MPFYAYQCDDCKEPFDVFVRSMNAQVEAVCPNCSGKHVEKKVTAPNAVGIASDGVSLGASSASCAPSG